MKIIISESQYKRLLTEDDKSFLDGMVDFPNIKNVIDPFVAKIFVTLKNDGSFTPNTQYLNSSLHNIFMRIVREIMSLTDFTKAECVVLAHNYSSVYWGDIVKASETGDWKSLVGKPLEFYGKFECPATVYHTGIVNGYSEGIGYAYATDYEDFINKKEQRIIDIEDNGSNINYDLSDVDWEPNWDFSYDTFSEEDIDYDNININLD